MARLKSAASASGSLLTFAPAAVAMMFAAVAPMTAVAAEPDRVRDAALGEPPARSSERVSLADVAVLAIQHGLDGFADRGASVVLEKLGEHAIDSTVGWLRHGFLAGSVFQETAAALCDEDRASFVTLQLPEALDAEEPASAQAPSGDEADAVENERPDFVPLFF